MAWAARFGRHAGLLTGTLRAGLERWPSRRPGGGVLQLAGHAYQEILPTVSGYQLHPDR